MPRRAVTKRYTHGWTNVDASDYQSSNKLSRKWHEAKEVNNGQLAKIDEVNLMKMTMSEVLKQLDNHYAHLATSKEVLTKHLSFMQGHFRSKKQYQVQFFGQNYQVL